MGATPAPPLAPSPAQPAAIRTGRVLAVSRALPAEIDIRGKRVRTSIVRERSTQPLALHATGAQGNDTAVHTEHLLAFPAAHYAYWARRFGVAGWPLTHWGENLVVDGWTEEELPIGTVLRVGTGAMLQVTSPRNPCFKLSWRLDQPDAVLADILASGKTGYYLRVLEPGPVFDGDAVAVAHMPDTAVTVADVARLMADRDQATPDSIRSVLALDGLGVQCAGMMRQALTDNLDRSRNRAHRWPGWRPFAVASVAEPAPGVRSFVLRPTDGAPLAAFRAGQHVLARITDAANRRHTRAWSLSDYQDQPCAYRLSVKRSARRAASALMHEVINEGSTIELRAPAGSFVLDRSSNHPTVLISAGIGLTPVLAMLKAYAALGPDAPPVHWIHVARNGRHYPYRAEVDALLATHPNTRRHVRFTAPEPEDRPGIDYDAAGRLTAEDLRRETALYRYPIFGREVELPGAVAEFYLCGPAAFEADVRAFLAAMGVAPGRVRSESFGAIPAEEGAPAHVRFARSGLEAEWLPGQSLLELAEAAGIAAAHECRAGTCHQCATALLEGAVAYDRAPAAAPEPGTALICQARPATPSLVLDL